MKHAALQRHILPAHRTTALCDSCTNTHHPADFGRNIAVFFPDLKEWFVYCPAIYQRLLPYTAWIPRAGGYVRLVPPPIADIL